MKKLLFTLGMLSALVVSGSGLAADIAQSAAASPSSSGPALPCAPTCGNQQGPELSGFAPGVQEQATNGVVMHKPDVDTAETTRTSMPNPALGGDALLAR